MACSINPFDLLKTGEIETIFRTVEHDPEQAARRNEDGVSLLMMALYYRQPELAEAIAGRLATLDAFEAAALGRTELLAGLLPPDRAPDPVSPDGFTPLHLAAFFDRSETADWLLAKGADPNAVAENPSLVRPIHSAVAARSPDLACLLLDYGADPNVQQAGGWTPLQAACMHGLAELARQLVGKGADPELRSDDGRDARSMLPEGSDPGDFGLPA
jgi:ankyrin repeat protein